MLEPTMPPPTMTTSAVCISALDRKRSSILAHAAVVLRDRPSGGSPGGGSISEGHVPPECVNRSALKSLHSTSVTCRGYRGCLVWNSMPLRCLLFSTNEEMVQPIWQVLTDLGIEGEYCASAVDAVERVTTQLFQIVITDWEDQPEAAFLLKTARDLKAAQRPLTLAMVNANTGLPEALQAGANSVLVRPIRIEQVRDTMSTACELLRSKIRPGAAPAESSAPKATAMAAAAGAPSTPVSRRPQPETSFRAGEFLATAPSVPGGQFDTDADSDVQKSMAQAEASEVEALTELEPTAAAVQDVPAEPIEPTEPSEPREALTGWASLQFRLAKSAPAKMQGESRKSEPLSYDHTPSGETPAGEDSGPRKKQNPPREEQAEAALFAYIAGETKETSEPAEKVHAKGTGVWVLAGLAVACVMLGIVPQTRQTLRTFYGRAAHAGGSWLNPPPAAVSPAVTQHENFGQAGDEYKLPSAPNIPDATTDASQIRVLPVIDPTAKPVKSSDTHNSQAQASGDAPANAMATGAGQAAIQEQSSAVALPSSDRPRPPLPAGRNSAPPAVSGGNNSPIPSSLKSQMASMTPEASGAKPVEAAMSSIEPVNLPSSEAWDLLIQPVDPVYPDAAKASGQKGSVVLQVLIARDGTVQEAKFLQGSFVFARAAIDAVKQWHFKPYLLNGRPVSVQSSITLN